MAGYRFAQHRKTIILIIPLLRPQAPKFGIFISAVFNLSNLIPFVRSTNSPRTKFSGLFSITRNMSRRRRQIYSAVAEGRSLKLGALNSRRQNYSFQFPVWFHISNQPTAVGRDGINSLTGIAWYALSSPSRFVIHTMPVLLRPSILVTVGAPVPT